MSSLAQEESRSLSENVKWGKRKTFAQGKVNLNYGRFLGYNKKVDGNLEIVEDEAEVVRTVFCLYLDGNSIQDIAEILTQRRIPTATDKEKWCTRTVANMLRNEKYKGDALLQKWYSKDYLTKHQVANRGELPQYYIENHHEAIIDPIIFDAVNLEMKRREGHKVTAAGLWCKVICPECGSTCTPIISRKNVIFECRNKNRNITECKTPTVKKQVILDGFMQALSSLDKEEALKNASAQLDRLVIKSEVLQRIEACRASMQKAANDMTSLNKNRKCEDYEIRHNEIEVCYNETYRELQNLEANIQDIKAKRTHLTCFIKVLSVPITEFEPKLWLLLLDRAELNKDGTVSYVLRNGARI